ncbi:ATP-binding protein [Intrasporangium mesophilum]
MTDIESSTRLFRELGDDYVGLLAIHTGLLREAFAAHRGVEVATEGDALVMAFDDAAEALRGCVDGQRALWAHPWPPGAEIRVRMGLHTAEAAPTGDNYVSLGLHQAARICAAAHGGQILLSEATATAVAADLPADVTLSVLGSFQLRGFTAPARLLQVCHPELQREFPALRVHGVVQHNLPFHRAAFVGRDDERRGLADLIRQTGVVTVVGLGGVGKTRLAVQVAFDVMDEFDDGAWLVELAAATDRQAVASAIAAVRQVSEVPGRSLEDLVIDDLSGKSAILVLDNCEQVLDAVAALTEELTQRSPHLAVLATSREPLAIDGEVVWRLNPLPVPDPAAANTAKDVGADAAVRLFEQRAALVRPGFRVSDANAADVATIVRHVDGLPLAIELAAAALADTSLTGVLEGLSDRFSLLTYGRRTAPGRHQTLRAALEWSLDLLGPDERLLFARLAAFARTGTIEAAGAVCGVPPLSERSVPQLLRRLRRGSLLSSGDDMERWTMLDSVHELAGLELTGSGEADELAARHREWFARRAETLGHDLGLRGHAQARADLLADLDNIRQALATAVSAGDTDGAIRTAAAMAPFWVSHGDWSAGVAHLRQALDLPDGSEPLHEPLRGPALAALGNLLILKGETTAAKECLQRAVEIATRHNDEVTLARSRSGLGYVAFRGSDLDGAQELWQEALGHAERAGDERVAAGILRSLAIASGSRGRQDEAGDLLDRAILSAEHAQDDQLLRLLFGSRAEIDLWVGRYEQAMDLYGRALGLASTIGDLSARPLLLCELGWVSLLSGDLATAERLASEAVELAEDLGNRRTLSSSLRLRAESLLRQSRFPEADVDVHRALVVAQGLAAPAEIAGVLCTQACIALERRDHAAAERLAESALAMTTLGHAMRSTFPRWVLGVVALARGRLETAADQFRAGEEHPVTEAAPRHRANSMWGLACVSLAAGRVPEAARLHRVALELRRDMGDHLGVAESLVGAAAVLAEADPRAAAVLLREAARLRSSCGAVTTPRQADDLAAVRSASGGPEHLLEADEPLLEADPVALALRALEVVEGSAGALPADDKGGQYGLAGR